MAQVPDFSMETALFARGIARVAGVDEVGRGPLCGPVTAAAVVLDPTRLPAGLNDSKKLTPARRAALAVEIRETAMAQAVVHVGVEEIDRLNILRASHVAMCRALDALLPQAEHALVDGNRLPADLSCPGTAVIKGDGCVMSIAAASILAKVARDAIMVDLAQQHPGYGWERNAGYPTQDHLEALRNLGATPHHRRSFRPVHNILYQDKTITS